MVKCEDGLSDLQIDDLRKRQAEIITRFNKSKGDGGSNVGLP